MQIKSFIGFASIIMLAACSDKNTEVMEKKGECPFGFGKEKSTGQIIKGEGTSNKDWWPNQLDLTVLRQNGLMSDPMGETFDYQKEFNSLDYDALKKDIKEFFNLVKSFVKWGSWQLRSIFHKNGLA